MPAGLLPGHLEREHIQCQPLTLQLLPMEGCQGQCNVLWEHLGLSSPRPRPHPCCGRFLATILTLTFQCCVVSQ